MLEECLRFDDLSAFVDADKGLQKDCVYTELFPD